jgi:hypothetical protein
MLYHDIFTSISGGNLPLIVEDGPCKCYSEEIGSVPYIKGNEPIEEGGGRECHDCELLVCLHDDFCTI